MSNGQGGLALDHVDITVHKGEILGVAGVSGNGQAELAEAIVGLEKIESGKLKLDGVEIGDWNIRRRREGGLGYIPEDRHCTGLVLELPVAENLILDRMDRPPFAKKGIIQPKAIAAFAETCIREYKVPPPADGKR